MFESRQRRETRKERRPVRAKRQGDSVLLLGGSGRETDVQKKKVTLLTAPHEGRPQSVLTRSWRSRVRSPQLPGRESSGKKVGTRPGVQTQQRHNCTLKKPHVSLPIFSDRTNALKKVRERPSTERMRAWATRALRRGKTNSLISDPQKMEEATQRERDLSNHLCMHGPVRKTRTLSFSTARASPARQCRETRSLSLKKKTSCRFGSSKIRKNEGLESRKTRR
ncbi:hypothetical protein TGME49_314440 [Toxoplasma gondii ME49]|uniref:Uncharacterized protein n=4 Tax=Toxoplasma gondii TaxID=5811 RepID=A0A125YZL4_TOXGV|nr:hypothetical protein TGME49_314440 [Toxoplasma gondii ME49]EPT25824.1 hypothetical protein TGME49_314440 [Toxoplasma gondii ME49]ESS35226.1 hypothetical protein TGVEG_314440 [Toxoplasma gondii VEG]KFG37651.1 hypothetical protein TGDOM2_314440 [Toxoplasma gondii GAB2-2007-GAL-DOM2]KYF40093.1 hypothetical protein TGARI_314440 [Toxoplasma gondii ARI]|eukprot:XP_018635373.1 hypothetical protein TGME49_314440 [Toxoplasma gondii ME49]